jgi:hypothetical protein
MVREIQAGWDDHPGQESRYGGHGTQAQAILIKRTNLSIHTEFYLDFPENIMKNHCVI